MNADGKQWDRRLSAAGLILLGVYFFRLTRVGLRGGFTPDDCMNLYRSWIFPVSALIKANFLFFLPSDFIRPMGEAWYRAVFAYAGWNAGPFHAANLAILTINIFLAYAAARRLTESRLAGLLAALLCCYERHWAPLYFDTGYVFDTLVFFFGMAALLGYVAIRQQGRNPRWWEAAGLACLYVCALNSKELAVSLPPVLLAYELLYHRPKSWAWARWRQFALIALMGAMTVGFIAGRAGVLAQNAAYQPEFTWSRFAASNGELLNAMFVALRWSTGVRLLAFWAVTLALALACRSRVLVLAWCFGVLSMLPMAFVPPRGGPQFYWPLFGWALYVGFVVAEATARGFRWLERRPHFWLERAAAAGFFLAVVIPLYGHYKKIGMSEARTVTDEAPVTMATAAQMHELFPTLPHGYRILFLDDPIRADWENMIFIVQLSYRDPSLVIKRVKQMKTPPTPTEIAAYDAVIGYRDGQLYNARPAR